KALEIDGTSQATFSGSATTDPLIVINANQLGSAFRINPGTGIDVALKTLDITNGNGSMFGSTYGGGIFLDRGDLTLTDSRVYNNGNGVTKVTFGGGIFVNVGTTLTMRGTTVSNNTASAHGGGIYIEGLVPVTITNSATNRSAITDNATLNQDGGGIYNVGILDITNTLIARNTAGRNGGGIANIFRSLTLTDSIVQGNTALGSTALGGGIYNNTSGLGGTILTITGSTIATNTSAGGGGVASILGIATISNTTIASNTATNATYGGGGILLGGGASLTINTGSVLVANKAAGPGGAIVVRNTATLNLNNVTAAGNTSDSGGGVELHATTTGNINNSTFVGNTSTNGGGGIANFGTLTLDKSTLIGNVAIVQGGGVYTNGTSTTVTNSTFAANSSDQGGGWYHAGGTVTLTSSTFSKNAAGLGGGIYVFGNNLSLGNTIVAGNNADDINGPLDAIDLGYNLLGYVNTPSFTKMATTTVDVADPMLASLGYYGNPNLTQTMALLPGSLALNKGNPGLAGTTDQRGVNRTGGVPDVGLPDIGAYESRGFTYTITGGNSQTTQLGTTFAQALEVTVTSNDPGLTNLTGGSITLTLPTTGATATGVLAQPITFAAGANTATFTLTAAGGIGTYSAEVSNVPSSALFFTLTNTTIPIFVLINPGQGKTYGQADPGLFGYTLTDMGGATISLSLNGAIERQAGENAGNYLFDISQLIALNTNYDIQSSTIITGAGANPVFTISPALLTITATRASGTSGQPFPTLGGTITGFQFADTASLVSGLTYTTPATIDSPAGTYLITPGSATARNYVFRYNPAVLSLAAAALPPPAILPPLDPPAISVTLNIPFFDTAAFNATLGRNNESLEDLLNTPYNEGFTVTYEGKYPYPGNILHLYSGDIRY
ncbi:MAG TPA: MBG domain-containing protein, partial [Roseimicrobium sp.]|nr:MBG domain-containing protein [Roseimicrobium sp.]